MWTPRQRPILCPRKGGKTLTLGGCNFSAPLNELPESTLDETSLRRASVRLLYSAALASFKSFRGIPISRTYLKMAAACNPHVLLKILALVKKPDAFSSILLIKDLIFSSANLNNDPRSRNGRRSPRLSLATQDLWMEDDVWAWANNNPDAKDKVLKTCSLGTCGKREARVAEYKRCAACHLVRL
jgi:hypothetical protein